MIDSSGRRALRANGTVLDILPIGQTIFVTGGLLIALFVLIKPEASSGLDTPGRIAFWTLHVGLGLAALGVSSRCLASRSLMPASTLAAVLITAAIAVAIAAPAYLALDALFAPYVIDLDAEPAASSLTSALLSEVMNLAPWFLISWLLINLPVLLPHPMASLRLEDAVEHRPDDDPTNTAPRTVPSVIDTRGLRLVDESSAARRSTPQVNGHGIRFLTTLPGVVGTDVVAVGSDLHYLNVWTVAGRTTVLGNLKDVVADLGTVGMQVHRSHWVAHAHVRRIVGTASDAACILSNELRVPVSRRRWKAVREQYGRGVVHTGNAKKEA